MCIAQSWILAVPNSLRQTWAESEFLFWGGGGVKVRCILMPGNLGGWGGGRGSDGFQVPSGGGGVLLAAAALKMSTRSLHPSHRKIDPRRS